MKVTIHKLFDYLLETTAQDPPECFIGFSLARSPKLGDFLPDLDPDLSLDWNGKSFLGLPALRQRVLEQPRRITCSSANSCPQATRSSPKPPAGHRRG
jgi:hypothetical protein